jgi:hypothetical protein
MTKITVTWFVEHRAVVDVKESEGVNTEAAAIAAADQYSRHHSTVWTTYKKEVAAYVD